jgi:hypothetical protein
MSVAMLFRAEMDGRNSSFADSPQTLAEIEIPAMPFLSRKVRFL